MSSPNPETPAQASAAPAAEPAEKSSILVGAPSSRKKSSTKTVKICKICGADLHGHTRYRSPKGDYWCKSCYMLGVTAQKKKQRAKQVRTILLMVAIAVILFFLLRTLL